ncbi:MAG: transcription elongation factor GreA [Candidatus Nealsonbacteria bacterium]|nr:transcription elongation factor GreA [Candidatus Nealsonbacteria bacterium]
MKQGTDEEKYLTPQGLANLKKELDHLKNVERKEMAERLKHAISFGDLSENAAYHEAKESQGFLEGRILELERIIRSARVIKETNQKDYVEIGSKIRLWLDGQEMELEIVGPNEADPLKGRISSASPLGQVIFRKRKGESGEVKIGDNKTKYKILEIH